MPINDASVSGLFNKQSLSDTPWLVAAASHAKRVFFLFGLSSPRIRQDDTRIGHFVVQAGWEDCQFMPALLPI
ncbi:hypothetical protein ACLKA6_013306 [Drosophila palustris]